MDLLWTSKSQGSLGLGVGEMDKTFCHGKFSGKSTPFVENNGNEMSVSG